MKKGEVTVDTPSSVAVDRRLGPEEGPEGRRWERRSVR